MSTHYDWPDEATFIVDVDLREGAPQHGGNMSMAEAVKDAIESRFDDHEVHIVQDGDVPPDEDDPDRWLVLRWPADDDTIRTLAQGLSEHVGLWDVLDDEVRAYWLGEARRFVEKGLGFLARDEPDRPEMPGDETACCGGSCSCGDGA